MPRLPFVSTFSVSRRRLCLVGMAVLYLLLNIASAKAATQIIVETQSGRSFAGSVDARTNLQSLWLRSQGPSTTVLRPIQWGRILAVATADRRYTAEEFRQAAEQIDMAGQEEEASPAAAPTSTVSSSMTIAERVQMGLAQERAVQNVEFDARIANWDRDAEIDGLEIRLAVYDARGKRLQITGVAEVELLGIPPQRLTRRAPYADEGLVRLGRWSQPTTPGDFDEGDAIFRLENQGGAWSDQPSLSRFGVVTLRFIVPGQGVLERRIEGIRIEPFSPIAP
ncbi:hypothetical protein [Lignipirellula cremea]|uniref:Uncharacterized protein n=1 Tax=Lignipirellula cremea TaxID=2528010 RepID=A0A518DP39_9BACT|nr:hypothetical protein [Lignipirellula cremea]QDU93573.1 hypothetical protein Pla8534_13530 [Lignipirellula cremea]